MIERFVRDNHLKVVDERSANAVLRGKITQLMTLRKRMGLHAASAVDVKAAGKNG